MTHRRRSARHSNMMDEYYAIRQAWWERMEHETMLYPTEVAEYRERHPQPTFKEFLMGRRQAA